MNIIQKSLFVLGLIITSLSTSVIAQNSDRIVCVGGTASEIVYSLGLGDHIVAVDQTSTYPKRLQELPNIGYRQKISAEGILVQKPTIIVYQSGYISQQTEEKLKSFGIVTVGIEVKYSVENTKTNIKKVATFFKKEMEAKKLIDQLDKDQKALEAYLADKKNRPKVSFVYARGSGTILLAGDDSFAQAIIQLAGGQLAVEGFNGFKPIDYEVLIKAQPDYLLFFDSGLQSLGGAQAILKNPNIASLELSQSNNSILSMEGLYMSGFGPRCLKAALDLAKQIH